VDPTWLAALVFAGISVAIAVGMLAAAAVLRVRTRNEPPTARLTYECGEEPEGVAWVRFHPRYYLVALVFVVFDVETAFILPWALNIEPLGRAAIVGMFVFVGVLVLGWLYALRKGALQWQ